MMLLHLILALELPRRVVDGAALLSGLNDTTEFIKHNVVPIFLGTHGTIQTARAIRHRKGSK